MDERCYQTLIGVDALVRRVDDPNWIVVDCRFDLADAGIGRSAYLEAHVPGAVYADLERDLSGPPLSDHGRHPLPGAAALTRTFERLGISADSQVVAYDDASGAIAARLWWLLRYMGHRAVAVLDGGWRAWLLAGQASSAGPQHRPSAVFQGQADRRRLVTVAEVGDAPLLVDARAPERFRGEFEPLDPVAGHIPGAVNHSFTNNLDANGNFLSRAQLRARLLDVLGATPPEDAVFYCGSGVTACHNLLALAHAGLGAGRLYAGSWSDWCADRGRPVARDA